MTLLIAGLLLFFVPHSISIFANSWRNNMVATMGEMAWKGFYALISIIGFVCIIKGYQMARLDPVIIWSPPVWTRHITFLLMLPVFVFLLAAYLPGKIQRTLKHPMLIATKTWALAHLISNGNLADILLFGSFLAWAVADRISLKRRETKSTPNLPASSLNDVIVVIGGLGAYAVFLVWGHYWLIGVPLVAF